MKAIIIREIKVGARVFIGLNIKPETYDKKPSYPNEGLPETMEFMKLFISKRSGFILYFTKYSRRL